MAIRTDRVGQLVEGNRRGRRTLVSPEGVPLEIQIAGKGERLTAFVVDMTIMLTAVICLYLMLAALFLSGSRMGVGMTVILFVAFLVRNLYFLHFELAWQGRTPGKKICGIRVINRRGGELTPSAVIARNLTREVEFFLPLSLLFSIGISANPLQALALFGWVLIIACLPLFNRDHLRAGDLIGGTMVIAMPKRVLLGDLAEASALSLAPSPAVPPAGPSGPEASQAIPQTVAGRVFTFRPEHLAIYGAFELQVLEELLRRPVGPASDVLLAEVCGKICRKIGWAESGEAPVAPADIRRFLTDFYAAERAELERGQLFGHFKEDQNSRGGPAPE